MSQRTIKAIGKNFLSYLLARRGGATKRARKLTLAVAKSVKSAFLLPGSACGGRHAVPEQEMIGCWLPRTARLSIGSWRSLVGSGKVVYYVLQVQWNCQSTFLHLWRQERRGKAEGFRGAGYQSRKQAGIG